MLINQTIDKLKAMRLGGMVRALEDQVNLPDIHQFSFDERLGLLVDMEETLRREKRFKTRIRSARLKQQAAMEDIDYRTKRGLSKSAMMSLSSCEWISKHQDMIFTGSTGVGKTYLACALIHKACQHGYTAIFFRLPRLFGELSLARADGSYPKLMNKLSKADVIILDDFGLSVLTPVESRDLLEIIEDRHKTRATIITSQLPLDKWFSAFTDSTVADAIMDRIVNNAHKFELKGPSMRKQTVKLDENSKKE